MNGVMRQIARLFDENHIDAISKQLNDDWTWIATDLLYISGPGEGPGRVTGITFSTDHNYCILNLRQESIEDVGIVEDEEGRPRLFVALKSGHYFEFSLIKEEVHEHT